MRLLSGEGERTADVLLPQLTEVAAADRDATLVGVEEPQQETGDGRLPRSARPDEGDAPARVEPQVEGLGAPASARAG